jgi:hypothetical protein
MKKKEAELSRRQVRVLLNEAYLHGWNNMGLLEFGEWLDHVVDRVK